MNCLPRRGPLQITPESSACIIRYASRNPSAAMPARRSAASSSERVSCFPPRSARSITFRLRTKIASFRPSFRYIVGVGRVHSGRRQGQHPPDVAGRDEMPGGPHEVGAEDRALVEGPVDVGVGQALRPQAQRPLRPAVVLGLDGAEPRDDVGRPAKPGRAEPWLRSRSR